MPRKMTLLIEFDRPKVIDFDVIRNFIIQWLETGGGCGNPDDPLFHSLKNVKVSKPITPWRPPGEP